MRGTYVSLLHASWKDRLPKPPRPGGIPWWKIILVTIFLIFLLTHGLWVGIMFALGA